METPLFLYPLIKCTPLILFEDVVLYKALSLCLFENINFPSDNDLDSETFVIMYTKKLHARFWSAENQRILTEQECKVVTQVQITSSARTLSEFRLFFWLSVMLIHVHY